MGSDLSVVGQFGRSQFVESAERQFPGVCLQGDTLYLWLRDVAEVLGDVPPSAGREQLYWLGRELHEIIVGYVELCLASQSRVPFQWPDPLIEEAGFSDPPPVSAEE